MGDPGCRPFLVPSGRCDCNKRSIKNVGVALVAIPTFFMLISARHHLTYYLNSR